SNSRGIAASASTAVSADGSGTAKPATKVSISPSATSSGATTASNAPTGKVAPAGATIRRKVPRAGASMTLVILVVSISRRSSPSAKLCPCCLSQPTTLPSVIVKPHFGIVIAVISGLVICSALLVSGRSFHQLLIPVADHRRMNPKLGRQLRQGLPPGKRRHRHSRLKFCAMLLPLYAHVSRPFGPVSL